MAFESLSHCYFMEDGVENGTVMTHNLFWIAHPDSYITGNTAGGSEGKQLLESCFNRRFSIHFIHGFKSKICI